MNTPDGPVESALPVPQVQEGYEELVRRVSASSTFERSHRLRAFFLYVCQCALENRPEAATEQQIGIHVFGRSPGYSPNEDNIVRSQARLLRLKLEHHFAHEGKDEPAVITIPKGQYLPVFTSRASALPPVAVPGSLPEIAEPVARRRNLLPIFIGLTVLFGAATILLASWVFRSLTRPHRVPPQAASVAQGRASVSVPGVVPQVAAAATAGEIRIAAGRVGAAHVDTFGRRWDSDRYYEGGVARSGPESLFPPVADPGLFQTMREAVTADLVVPQTEREFRYHIPAPPGAYELRLHFADPLRTADVKTQQDAQNVRHFHVNYNGRRLLTGFDPTAAGGSAPVDVRVFKDISPAEDGKIHLEFIAGPERPFVNALELTPGTRGRLRPIRLSARPTDFVDSDGTRWSGNNYFVHGRTGNYFNPAKGPQLPELYAYEHFGNFSYAIPVPPGSYTVRLHFAESFFTPLIPAAFCKGAGCRVFDVMCNGVVLLQDFDIFQAASGAFRPVVRTFTGLRPDGQGKLVLSFSPKVNYAEVRAIEVFDEAK